jgi:hypothetical protein
MCGARGAIGGGPDWIDRVNDPDGVDHLFTFMAAARGDQRALVDTA